MKNKIERDPWDIPLSTRKAEFLAAKKSGKKVALLLYPEENKASSFRYRGYNIYQATKNSKEWQLVYFFTTELGTVFDLVEGTDLLIFGRITRWEPEYDELSLLAKQNGARVLQDLDDCVCGTYYIKETFNLICPDRTDQDYWINTCAHYELISYLADGFIVTNDYLGQRLSETHNNKPYCVIRNFLCEEQISYAEELIKNKLTTKNDGFVMGYFSGSHTHAADFEVIFPEVIDFLSQHNDAKLRIVGLLRLPESAKEYVRRGQIEFVPLVDFLTLGKLISEVDVNLVPLDNNTFSNCKSDLKFYEAALVKTPTVASPTFAFKKAIKNGETGFLCRPGEWYSTLQRLYEEAGLGEKIASSANEYCLKTYSPEACVSEIEETYDFFIES